MTSYPMVVSFVNFEVNHERLKMIRKQFLPIISSSLQELFPVILYSIPFSANQLCGPVNYLIPLELHLVAFG